MFERQDAFLFTGMNPSLNYSQVNYDRVIGENGAIILFYND